MMQTRAPFSPPLRFPGMFGGYGGGTANADGSVEPLPNRVPHPEEQARQMPPQQVQPAQPMPSPPPGIFGNPYRQQAAPGSPLGGSLRQPFDYEAALAKMLPDQKKPSTLKKIATILGPALAGASGNQALANQLTQQIWTRRRDADNARREATMKLLGWQHDDWSRQNGADLRAALPFSSGRDRVMYDPATGQSNIVYDGPEDFESYAETMGLQPGTPEYSRATEDYVLRSNGPTAFQRDKELDDHRTGNDQRLEGMRYGNRVRMEGVRQGNRLGMEGVRQGNRIEVRETPTYRDKHPAAGGRAGAPRKVSSPAEAQALPAGTIYQTPDGQVFKR